MAEIATPLDFLGINYYSRSVMLMGDGERAPTALPGPRRTS